MSKVPGSSGYSNQHVHRKIDTYTLITIGEILSVTGTLAIIGAIGSVNVLTAAFPFLIAAIAAIGPAGWVALSIIVLVIGICCVMGGIKRSAYKKYLKMTQQHDEKQKLNQKTKETLLDLKIPATREERLKYYKELKKELNLIFFIDELKEITQEPLSDLEYMLAELEIIKLIIQETGVAKEIPQDLRDYIDNKNLMEAQRIQIQRLLTQLENITPTNRLKVSEKVRDV